MSGATFDRDEVRRLYEVHGPALLAYACAFLRDPSEAEDMLHQVFLELIVLRVWGQLTFEEIGGVVGISPNTAASRYRYGLAKLTEVWNGRT